LIPNIGLLLLSSIILLSAVIIVLKNTGWQTMFYYHLFILESEYACLTFNIVHHIFNYKNQFYRFIHNVKEPIAKQRKTTTSKTVDYFHKSLEFCSGSK